MGLLKNTHPNIKTDLGVNLQGMMYKVIKLYSSKIKRVTPSLFLKVKDILSWFFSE